MRSPLSRSRALGFLVLAATLASLGATATPAKAGIGLACGGSTSQAFAPWYDFASYWYAPNGGFEAGSTAGTSPEARRSFPATRRCYNHGAGERYSLSLPKGSSATSPPMCVGLFFSKMRFFAANYGSPKSKLKVQVVYNGGVGGLLSFVTKLLKLSDVGYVTPRVCLAALDAGRDAQRRAAAP